MDKTKIDKEMFLKKVALVKINTKFLTVEFMYVNDIISPLTVFKFITLISDDSIWDKFNDKTDNIMQLDDTMFLNIKSGYKDGSLTVTELRRIIMKTPRISIDHNPTILSDNFYYILDKLITVENSVKKHSIPKNLPNIIKGEIDRDLEYLKFNDFKTTGYDCNIITEIYNDDKETNYDLVLEFENRVGSFILGFIKPPNTSNLYDKVFLDEFTIVSDIGFTIPFKIFERLERRIKNIFLFTANCEFKITNDNQYKYDKAYNNVEVIK